MPKVQGPAHGGHPVGEGAAGEEGAAQADGRGLGAGLTIVSRFHNILQSFGSLIRSAGMTATASISISQSGSISWATWTRVLAG